MPSNKRLQDLSKQFGDTGAKASQARRQRVIDWAGENQPLVEMVERTGERPRLVDKMNFSPWSGVRDIQATWAEKMDDRLQAQEELAGLGARDKRQEALEAELNRALVKGNEEQVNTMRSLKGDQPVSYPEELPVWSRIRKGGY